MRRSACLKIALITVLIAAPVAALIVGGGILWRRWRWEKQFDVEIRNAAARYRIDPLLVKAVIWQESKFNPKAKGRAGEIGLMQVQEIAAEEWAESEHLKDFTHAQIWEP